jgi:hypothetical protein
LVNVVDNDFVNGDISAFINELLATPAESIDADCHIDASLLARAQQTEQATIDLYDD